MRWDNKIIPSGQLYGGKKLPVFQSRSRSEFDEKLHFLRIWKIKERMINQTKLVSPHTVFPTKIYLSEQDLKSHTVVHDTFQNENEM